MKAANGWLLEKKNKERKDKNMSALLDEVTKLLTESELNYELHCEDGKEVVRLGQMSKDPAYNLLIHVDEGLAVVNVIGAANCFMPEDKRTEACVLLNESNYRCPHKSYIDPEDGQLMAQKCVDVDGGALNKEVLTVALASVHTAILHNYDALMRLRYGN